MLDIKADEPWHPEILTDEDISNKGYEKLLDEAEEREINLCKTIPKEEDWKMARSYLIYPNEMVTKQTLKNTTR
jgi:hypothetical protein